MRLEDVALLYVGKPDEIRCHIICCSLVNLMRLDITSFVVRW